MVVAQMIVSSETLYLIFQHVANLLVHGPPPLEILYVRETLNAAQLKVMVDDTSHIGVEGEQRKITLMAYSSKFAPAFLPSTITQPSVSLYLTSLLLFFLLG